MKIGMAAPVAAFAVLLFGVSRAFGQIEGDLTSMTFVESSCTLTMFLSMRAAWASEDEPCHQKLSMEMWTFMKAKGSAQDGEAQLVYTECMREPEMGLLELITPDVAVDIQSRGGVGDWNSDIVGAGPGNIVGESEHASTLQCNGPEDLEAICTDDQVTKATRVLATVGSHGHSRTLPRRFQYDTNEGVVAHEVDKLIEGLEDLCCLRTTGEDQTLCVMSDSFNAWNDTLRLERSGDLPPVEVVEDFPDKTKVKDEGSAMVELAYDIAGGATFKFNSAWYGEQTFADDIGILAGVEDCDVIVDDVRYFAQPSFRDGVVSEAVDAATNDHDVLYFASAGNDGFGYRAVSEWECPTDIFDVDFIAPCTRGVASHVFHPESTASLNRHLFSFLSPIDNQLPLLVKWDDDEGDAREMTMIMYSADDGILKTQGIATNDIGAATIRLNAPGDGQDGTVQHVNGISYTANSLVPLLVPIALFLPLDQSRQQQLSSMLSRAKHLTRHKYEYHWISIHRLSGETLEEVDLQIVASGNQFMEVYPLAEDGSIYGQACATKAFSVAAISHTSASGGGGVFADPEPAAVEDFSSRGPCMVRDGTDLSERNHPVTTAADELTTSSYGFYTFPGTSAAAPVAAAIATIIRAACFPRVVTYSDMMEMLTSYEYTIDATSDAKGAAETFGVEAGYGIISARKMCLWVAQNCPETCPNSGVGAHGDPHLVGLAGQKFDFTGQSNSWYALLSAWGTYHVNMRVTAPIADLAMVTYITGISVQTKDGDGVSHSIVIFVTDPSEFETSCPEDGQVCIGDGALTVLLDGILVVSSGEEELGPGVSFMAANIPGECRPFGFERYWQQKVREAELLAAAEMGHRRLMHVSSADRWIAEDPSATNPDECKEYVSHAIEHDSLFAHQSDHVSFQIVTPRLTLRLNHGKLHQLPERDPTDTFDIPDHTTFQMNLGFLSMTRDDTMQGVIGETSVPTIDKHGAKFMSGLKSIRGQEDDYKVDGALGKTFKQLMTGV